MSNEINPFEFDAVIKKLRDYCYSQGFTECYTSSKLGIMAACEDVKTLATYAYNGKLWPLPQSQQMHLEEVILKNPSMKGCFTVGTSFRNEPNPVAGRHDKIFPMFEFEGFGDQNDLIAFERGLLEALGYGPADSFPEVEYCEIAKKYGVEELTHDHEEQLYREYGPVCILKNFPEHTDPYWNMNRRDDGIAQKVDIILSGQECFGSAYRSTDIAQMRENFFRIDGGRYSDTLFTQFSHTRVLAELDEYLKFDFKPRFGAGIGLTRLIRSMKKENLL